ncbi:MAG TPA: Crp/Fnr family transcriptional regulator [Terracidiphilus sp.]|nr:Crp/Fnr family transcriptional regulator [Terracidiphilus sp.]
MQPEASFRPNSTAAHPVAELLACPPAAETLLNEGARHIEFKEGSTLFHQGEPCHGLYLIVAGELLRRAERMETRLMLGTVSAGELVELAAALSAMPHSYTLTAQSQGSAVLLAMEPLHRAFAAYPPLRMHLLEELAREVSRSYSSCVARLNAVRRRGPGLHQAGH